MPVQLQYAMFQEPPIHLETTREQYGAVAVIVETVVQIQLYMQTVYSILHIRTPAQVS